VGGGDCGSWLDCGCGFGFLMAFTATAAIVMIIAAVPAMIAGLLKSEPSGFEVQMLVSVALTDNSSYAVGVVSSGVAVS